MRHVFFYLGFCACAFLGGGMVVTLGPRLGAQANAQSPAENGNTGLDMMRLSERFEAIARKLSPAVVYVEATKPARTPGTAAKPSSSLEESGSGVLVRFGAARQVLVLTNNHVIAQATPEQITVTLADNRLLHPNRVWTDPESDVAILGLEADNLPTATLGDSDSVKVGQWVLAIGSPFGLNQTVTHGIISAKERGQVSLGSTIRIKDFLQTDAAINPGSSGGPLINMQGEVIGINTAIASHSGSNSGVAFSIPANLIKRVMAQLLDKGNVTRGYLGMQLAASFEVNDALKLGLTRAEGAWVEKVLPGTPAETAGLRPNDVVMKVEDQSIRDENHMINLISTFRAGQRVRMQVWRDSKTLTLEAEIGEWDPKRFR